jgi:hypothetical protein
MELGASSISLAVRDIQALGGLVWGRSTTSGQDADSVAAPAKLWLCQTEG